MIMAIGVMVLLALIMVSIGGMRSVIWTDVCQAAIFVLAALAVSRYNASPWIFRKSGTTSVIPVRGRHQN